MNTTERRRFEALMADRRAIELAAAWLRQNASQENYAGLSDHSRALQIALLLDSLSLQLDRVPSGLRIEAVRVAEWLVGGSANVRF